MQYTGSYPSPLGKILLRADDVGLTELRFEETDCADDDAPILRQAKEWLEVYFSGWEPEFTPPLSLHGTPFRLTVWEEMRKIPYGTTTTYAAIAKALETAPNGRHTSPRAVGNAIAANPVWLILPCHRVIGSDASLTGYAGGLERKRQLLILEKSIQNVK